MPPTAARSIIALPAGSSTSFSAQRSTDFTGRAGPALSARHPRRSRRSRGGRTRELRPLPTSGPGRSRRSGRRHRASVCSRSKGPCRLHCRSRFRSAARDRSKRSDDATPRRTAGTTSPSKAGHGQETCPRRRAGKPAVRRINARPFAGVASCPMSPRSTWPAKSDENLLIIGFLPDSVRGGHHRSGRVPRSGTYHEQMRPANAWTSGPHGVRAGAE